MLKTQAVYLTGLDVGTTVYLTERPALVADKLARQLIARWGGDSTCGVVGLAMRYQSELARLGGDSLTALAPFVRATRDDDRPFDLDTLRDWRNVPRIQQAALLLHVGFLVGRPLPEIPVTMRAEALLAEDDATPVTFCSPFIAAVLKSERASYVELETILSTEDAFNLAELINIDAIRNWREAYSRKLKGNT